MPVCYDTSHTSYRPATSASGRSFGRSFGSSSGSSFGSASGRSFGSSPGGLHPKVTFYAMEGCPHCTAALPGFRAAMEKGEDMNVEFGIVHNTTPEGMRKIKMANVRSFPTVIGVHNNEIHSYSGNRSEQSYIDFAKSMIA